MRETTTGEGGPYDSDRSDDALRRAFTDGRVPIALYGLGKMGLPVAATFADRFGAVEGVDLDQSVVSAVEAGDCPVRGEPQLPELVATVVDEAALTATTNGDRAATDAAVHVVIVPTLIDEAKEPDLTHLQAATETIGAGLSVGDVVFVESTVPPRTCRDVILPTLEAESGLDRGEFGLAFCPERTASGRALRDIQRSYPKVVGGVDEESTRVARVVYSEVTDNEVIPVADCTTAECVKLFEGFYRDVNVALANELATFTDEIGVDVVDAIEVANTVPYCDLHTPGAGVGGHCIPYYPYFLLNEFETPAEMLATARQTNDSMPAFAVDRLVDLLEGEAFDVNTMAAGSKADARPLAGAQVTVLGVTYRPGVDEIRASPAHGVVDGCRDRGASVSVVDPVCTDLAAFDARPLTVEAFQRSTPDGVVLVTAQPGFEAIDWTAFQELAVVDGRQALDLTGTPHRVYTIGRGRTN